MTDPEPDDSVIADQKFPPPPSPEELAALTRRRDIVAVHTASRLWRVHRTTGRHAIDWNTLRHFGPVPGGRFDPHPPPPGESRDEGVAYWAVDRVDTAIAEAFGVTRAIDRSAGAPILVGARLRRTVRLLDVSAAWPTRAGASQAIATGSRARAQQWARAIRRALPEVDGLWYRSSMNGGQPCIALWSPAADALPVTADFSRSLADPALSPLLFRTAEQLGYTIG